MTEEHDRILTMGFYQDHFFIDIKSEIYSDAWVMLLTVMLDL